MAPLRNLDETLAGWDLLLESVPKGPIAKGVLLVGNGMAWLQGVDVGALVSAASFGLLAAVTAAIAAWEKVYQQRRRHRLQDHEDDLAQARATAQAQVEEARLAEEARRDSLAAKLAELSALVEAGNQRVEDANRKLHDQRNEFGARLAEAAAERAAENDRHREEVRRLMDQIGRLMDQHQSLYDTIEQQARELSRSSRRSKAVMDRLHVPEPDSDGDAPAGTPAADDGGDDADGH